MSGVKYGTECLVLNCRYAACVPYVLYMYVLPTYRGKVIKIKVTAKVYRHNSSVPSLGLNHRRREITLLLHLLSLILASMAGLDLSQTVAILTSSSERTIEIFRLPHNKQYLHNYPPIPRLFPSRPSLKAQIPPESSSAKDKQKADRDDTPDADPYIVSPPSLCIRLDVPPKDIRLGWVFGRDATRCDILLGDQAGSMISKMHFRIAFDWDQGIPHIYNMSKNGTTVRLPGSRLFKILEVGERYALLENLVTYIVGHLTFGVRRPALELQNKTTYQANWHDYRRQVQKDPPGLTSLQVGSHPGTTTPQLVQGSTSKGAYGLGGILGQGSFGVVYLAEQLATGITYAMKRCIATKECQRERFKKEIDIYKTLEHVSILRSYF